MSNYLVNNEDKMNYMKGLIRIARADKIIMDEEKEFFYAVSKGMNLDETSMTEINAFWEVESYDALSFSNRKTALFFLQEAIQLCMVDEDYADDEKAEIRLIASELDFSEKVVSDIEAWVEEGLLWRKKGEVLLERLSAE